MMAELQGHSNRLKTKSISKWVIYQFSLKIPGFYISCPSETHLTYDKLLSSVRAYECVCSVKKTLSTLWEEEDAGQSDAVATGNTGGQQQPANEQEWTNLEETGEKCTDSPRMTEGFQRERPQLHMTAQ